MTKTKLTIAIPTYNRKKQLENTLLRLNKNHLIDKVNILIIDNCSDYYASDLILGLDLKNKENITVIRNPANIGGPANIARCFEMVNSDWMWLLGDDDEPSIEAIKNILSDIENLQNERCILIKYSCDQLKLAKKTRLVGLESLLDYYYQPQNSNALGNLYYISTGVYKVSALKKYVKQAYQFTNSFIPQTMIVLFFLSDHPDYFVKLKEESIVSWIEPDHKNKYSILTVGLGLAYSLRNIFFNIDKESDSKFRELFQALFTKDLRYYFLIFQKMGEQDGNFRKYKNQYKELYVFNKINMKLHKKIEFWALYFLIGKSFFISIARKLSARFDKSFSVPLVLPYERV